jgi:hypothetical protein
MELRKRDEAERKAYLMGYVSAMTFCSSLLQNALDKMQRHLEAVKLQQPKGEDDVKRR